MNKKNKSKNKFKIKQIFSLSMCRDMSLLWKSQLSPWTWPSKIQQTVVSFYSVNHKKHINLLLLLLLNSLLDQHHFSDSGVLLKQNFFQNQLYNFFNDHETLDDGWYLLGKSIKNSDNSTYIYLTTHKQPLFLLAEATQVWRPGSKIIELFF